MRATTHLVELERVEEVVELAVLGRLVEAHKVLLQTVQRELLLVVDVDLERLQGEREKDRQSLSLGLPRRAGKRKTDARSA